MELMNFSGNANSHPPSIPPLGHLTRLFLAITFILVFSSLAHASYERRYTTIANSGMTYTGRPLGLSSKKALERAITAALTDSAYYSRMSETKP